MQTGWFSDHRRNHQWCLLHSDVPASVAMTSKHTNHQHDKVCLMWEATEMYHWESLSNPPYSSELIPSHYHLFGTSKYYMGSALWEWDGSPKAMHTVDIFKFIQCWQKCVEHDGFCGKLTEHVHLLRMVLVCVHVPMLYKHAQYFQHEPLQTYQVHKYLFTHPCAQFPLVWTITVFKFSRFNYSFSRSSWL